MTRTAFLATAVCACVSAGAALAQDTPPGFTIGAGFGYATGPYVGDEDEGLGFVPILRYQGAGFRIGTTGLAVDVVNTPQTRLELLVQPRFFALVSTDSPELAGIDRDITFDGGARLSYELGPDTRVTGTFLQEVTSEHEGREVTLEIDQQVYVGNFPLGLSAGASWQSSDLTGYLYGVTAGEAIAGRPAYAPDASVTPFIGVSTAIPLASNLFMTGSLKAAYLPNTITDSPIVEDSAVVSASIGLGFSF